MQNRASGTTSLETPKVKKIFFENKKNNDFKKVDMNVLLNRVKFEKKSELKKNLILAAGVIGALSITGFITVL